MSIRDTIIEKVNRVKELNDEILDLLETSNADDKLFTDEENKSTQFSLSSKAILIKINRTVETFSSDRTDTSSTMTSKRFTIRLPKIEIKPFNGDVEEWNEFWDSYVHAVHDSDCSNVQKMTYLKSLLSGPAAATISGFKISDENYKLAIDLLKERYDNKQLLISTHMNNLLKLEPVTSLDEILLLRQIYDRVESQIRSLENLDIDSKNYGPLLIPVLMSKLPQDLNLIISRKFTGNDSWDISL